MAADFLIQLVHSSFPSFPSVGFNCSFWDEWTVLALRVVFVRDGDVLKVDFVGDQGAVRDYLRNRR